MINDTIDRPFPNRARRLKEWMVDKEAKKISKIVSKLYSSNTVENSTNSPPDTIVRFNCKSTLLFEIH